MSRLEFCFLFCRLQALGLIRNIFIFCHFRHQHSYKTFSSHFIFGHILQITRRHIDRSELNLIRTTSKCFALTQRTFHEDESHKTLTICPLYKDIYGVRWRCNKRNYAVPNEIAVHKTNAKGDRGIDFTQSAVIFHHSSTLVPIGSRIFRNYDVTLSLLYRLNRKWGRQVKVNKLFSRLTELFHFFLAPLSPVQVPVTRLRLGSITSCCVEKEPELLLEFSSSLGGTHGGLNRATEIESRLGPLSDVFSRKTRLIKSFQTCNCYYNGYW